VTLLSFSIIKGLTPDPACDIVSTLVNGNTSTEVSIFKTPNIKEITMTEITANHNTLVDTKDFSFHFKKDKLGNKRPSVELKLAVPSIEGIIEILNKGGKEMELLQDAMYDVIRAQAASIVSDDEKISQETFPFEKALWTSIANMPKADRRSNSISVELWEAFSKDYMEVMPAVTGKTQDAVSNAVQVYLKKFSMFKTNKDVLSKLKDQLSIYVEHSKNVDQFVDIIDLLVSKLEGYMKADDIQLLADNL